jgi:hypothetical protein
MGRVPAEFARHLHCFYDEMPHCLFIDMLSSLGSFTELGWEWLEVGYWSSEDRLSKITRAEVYIPLRKILLHKVVLEW